MHDARQRHWRNRSVVMFAHGADPVMTMFERASAVTLDAMEQGWGGPPFDPFTLAEMRGIQVVPNSEVLDARTIPAKGDRVTIEYNPDRARPRIRYSVAHEIAHTLFRDCAERIRNRGARHQFGPDEWELEMLCNIGAAEFLMPTGSLSELSNKTISISDILELRKVFEVSTESILLRLTRVTDNPYVMFAASHRSSTNSRYSIDYSVSSRTTEAQLAANSILPRDSLVAACTAMGYTVKADEDWPGIGKVHFECVGVSPYPESIYPRVIGFLSPMDAKVQSAERMRFVTGDATEPCGNGPMILAHVVNDATPNWGAGFGKIVQQKWPEVQRRFRDTWYNSSRKRLGEVFFSEADPQLIVCQMVSQRGYGSSDRPRLRYSALRECLNLLRDHALCSKASIHMPRIGSGEAGGSWALISALIDEVLCAAGLSVTIYDLPKSRQRRPVQAGLFDLAR